MRYIKLVLDFYHPWANNAGFYLGRDLGFYKEEGIDLDIVPYDPYRGDSLGRLLANEADFAYNYPNRLMMRNETGGNLFSVAACNSRSFEALIYDKRHPVTSFADMEGKVVGVPRSPRVRAILKYMMAKSGKDPARVTFKEYYPNEPDPFDIHRGVVDCLYGTFWGWEGVLAQLQDENILWKEVAELNAPYCHTQIIAVKKSFAHRNPQLVRGFLRATYRGFAAAAAQPAQAAESMVLVAPYYSRAQFSAAISAIAETWGLDSWGRHNRPLIASYTHWLAAHGFLESEKGHEKDFTDEYLPE